MDIFLTTLIRAARARLPDPFYVTLPKVVHPGQAAALHTLLNAFEKKKKLKPNTIKVELMIETPQSIIGFGGAVPLRETVNALLGRCASAHFGAYDYTASCNITAAHQGMEHQSCDFARHVMQAALAGTGVNISDGATNVLPVGPPSPTDGSLPYERDRENIKSRAPRVEAAL